MTHLKSDLVGLSDYAWSRLRTRLTGLTDEEYLWDPAPDCWSVRAVGDGTFAMDSAALPPEPAPFTTAAWRISHVIDVLQAERTATWVDVAPTPEDGEPTVPGTAADALRALDRAHAAWRRRLTAVDEDGLGTTMGPIAGPYAAHTRLSFILHILDELIHHGAEIAVVRDLYRASRPREPFVAACLGGDVAVAEALRAADPGVVDVARSGQPDLLRLAAARQRWDVVRLLVELGFPVDLAAGEPGASALHYAAGAGEFEVVRLLVERGADRGVADPTFSDTPRGWAAHFGHDKVAAYLDALQA
ncbi:ankyrin repeat domain-containing protein [Actinopolymorpha sp. B11F2]|uniref:ankyrin repeat domain-containing protein n=1 Tax=Actinopolymorpha sp. B11F2 TaxID=3160862 RepID=UPI0032E43639